MGGAGFRRPGASGSHCIARRFDVFSNQRRIGKGHMLFAQRFLRPLAFGLLLAETRKVFID